MQQQSPFQLSPGYTLYRFFAFFVLLLSLVANPSAARADYLWYHDLRGDSSVNQDTRSIPDSTLVDKAGDVIVSGFLQRKNGEIATVAYDKTGVFLWKQSIPGNAIERPRLATNSEGDILVFITYQEYSRRLPILLKYSKQGILISKSTLDAGTNNGVSYFGTYLVDASDNIYLCGTEAIYNGNSFFASILVISKFSPELTRLWTQTIANSNSDNNAELVNASLDNDSNLIVTGYEQSENECLLGKYDPNGNLLFLQTLSGEQSPNFSSLFLTTDKEDSIYLSGIHQYDVSHARLVVTKYSSAGQQAWVRYDDGGGEDDLGDYYSSGPIIIDADGDLVASGDIAISSHVSKRSLIKYDRDGNRLWIHRTSRYYAVLDRVVGLYSDESCNLYVVEQVLPKLSETRMLPHGIVGVSELDSAGNSLWRQNYLGAHVHPGNALVTSSAFDASSGILYVCGTSDFNPVTTRQIFLEKDWFTVAYQP